MATADEYAQWIVANASKKGTPEFDTVAKAYQLAKSESAPVGDTPSAPPANIGVSGFPDAVRQTLQEKDWGTRNALGLGAQINKGVHGFTTLLGQKNNPLKSQAADVASSEAPVGSIIGEGMKYAPALAASGVVVPAAIASGIGLLTQPSEQTQEGMESRLGAGAQEGAFALAGGGLAKGIGATYKAFKRYGADASARRIVGDVVGDKAQALALLNNGKTAGLSTEQALADLNQPALAGLSNITKSTSSESTAFHKQLSDAQEAARLASLRSVTPDLVSAKSVRDSAASPFYKQAEQTTITLDKPFMNLFGRMPNGTLEAAANIARMEGRPFVMGQHIPAHKVPTGMLDSSGKEIMRDVPESFPKITGESMHYIKRALSDISNAVDPSKGIGRDAQVAARSVLSDFLPAFEKAIPVYGTARNTFAKESVPVNQSTVLQALAAKLKSSSGGERATSFLNVLGDGEQALLKKATGFPRHQSGDLSKVLSSNQMATVDDISSQLIRDSNVASQLAAPGSRNAALKVIQSDTLQSRIPNLLSRPAMVANKALGELETRLSAKTLAKLDTAMRDPQEMARLLRDVPKADRGIITNMLMMNPAGLAAALTSNASSQQDNQQLAEQLRRSN